MEKPFINSHNKSCLLHTGNGCHRNIDPGSNLQRAVEVYLDAKKAGMKITEPSYSALIRCYSGNGLPLEAMKVYRELEELNLTPKHRTFTPLLDCLSHEKLTDLCFELFNRMIEIYELIPLEKDYMRLMNIYMHRLFVMLLLIMIIITACFGYATRQAMIASFLSLMP